MKPVRNRYIYLFLFAWLNILFWPVFAPANENVLDLKDITTFSFLQEDGQAVIIANIDEEKLINSLAANTEAGRVVINVNDTADVIKARFSANALEALAGLNNSVEINTPAGSFIIPATKINILEAATELEADAGGLTIDFVVARSNPNLAAKIEQYTREKQLVPVSTPLDLRVEAVYGDKKVGVDSYDGYLTNKVKINSTVDENYTVGIVLDSRGKLNPVPTQFTEVKGEKTAVIKHRTGGSFIVVEHRQGFADMSSHWAGAEVNILASKLIINGISQDKFGPELLVDRAQLSTFFVKALGHRPEPGPGPFRDVRADGWYAEAVNTAVKNGIVKGYSGGLFKPRDMVTREQMVALAIRSLEIAKESTLTLSDSEVNYYLQAFKDKDRISPWARRYMAAGIKNRIITGSNGYLNPRQYCTRAEAAVILKKMMITGELLSPAYTIISPADNLITNEKTISVSGTVGEGGTVDINGNVAETDVMGNFNLPVDLTAGSNIIRIKVTDPTGNISTINRRVLYEASPANSDLNANSYVVTNKNTYNVTGTAGTGSSVTVNGTKVNTDSQGNYSRTLPLNSGKNLITIIITDPFGNKTTINRTVVCDTTPPTLNIATPNDNTETGNEILVVTGYTEAGNVVSINGTTVDVDNKGNFSKVLELKVGSNKITVDAVDQAGNTATVTRTVSFNDNRVSALTVPDKAGIGKVSVKYTLSTEGYVTVKIYKENDVTLRTILDNVFKKAGTYTQMWDGKDRNRVLVPEGNYKAVVEFRNSDGEIIGRQTKTFSAYRVPAFKNVKADPGVFNPANGEKCLIKFSLSEPALVTGRILLGSKTVSTLVYNESKSAGTYSLEWDGRDVAGNRLGDGIYNFIIEAVNPSEPFFKTISRGSTAVETGAPVITGFTVPQLFQIGVSNKINFTLSEKAQVTLKVVDSTGQTVNTLLSQIYRNSGPNLVSWDGRVKGGGYIAEGTYTLEISAKDSFGKSSNTLTTSFPAGLRHKIDKAKVNPNPFNPALKNSKVTISYTVSVKALISVEILKGNTVIRNIVSNRMDKAGANSVQWDGRDNAGKIVMPGAYYFRITAVNPAYKTLYSFYKGFVTVKDSASSLKKESLILTAANRSNKQQQAFETGEIFKPAAVPLISNVNVNPPFFNPRNGEETSLSYMISGEALVSVTVYNNSGAIRTLLTGQPVNSQSSLIWDGLDEQGNFLNDGAYYFRIEAVNPVDPAKKSIFNRIVNIDSGGPIISSLQLTPEPFSPYAAKYMNIRFSVNENARVTIEIFKDGSLIRTVIKDSYRKAGSVTAAWDGKNNSGNYPDPGVYTVVISAVDASGNQSEKKGEVTFEPYLVISSTSPAGDSTEASVNSSIVVAFKNPVNKGDKFNEIQLQVEGISVSCELKINGDKLVLTPYNSLAYGTLYKVIIPAGAVKGSRGVPMGNSYSFSFTTEGAPRNMSGRVSLADAAVSVFSVTGKNTVATVTLNETDAHALISKNMAGSTVVIPAAVEAEIIKVKLSGNFIKFLADNKMTIEINNPKASLVFPAALIDLKSLFLRPEVSSDGLTINFILSFANSQDEANLRKLTVKSGMKTLVSPVAFRLEAMAGGIKKEINDFVGYAALLINLPSSVDANSSGGVILNGSMSLSPRPARFTAVNGKTVVTLKTRTTGLFTVIEYKKAFSDLKGHWAKKDIETLASKLIISGTAGKTFAPDRSVTRAEFITMIVKALGLKPGLAQGGFTDVRAENWYYEAVSAAVEAGIISGYPDGTFRPNAVIKREEAAAIIMRALEAAGTHISITDSETKSSLARFRDKKEIATWAQVLVAKAVKNGMVRGFGNGSFYPGRNITRAEAAAMLTRLLASAGLI